MSTTPYSVVLGEPRLANSAPSPVDHQPFYKVAHGFTFHTLTILHTNVALPHKQSVLQYLAKLSLLPLILGLHNRANRGEINSGSVWLRSFLFITEFCIEATVSDPMWCINGKWTDSFSAFLLSWIIKTLYTACLIHPFTQALFSCAFLIAFYVTFTLQWMYQRAAWG